VACDEWHPATIFVAGRFDRYCSNEIILSLALVLDQDVVAGTCRPYFVLEYVAGGNLAEKLDGTPQSPRLASQFVEVLARAVQAAHDNGVVHRDLKPANILLNPADKDPAGAGESTSGPDAAAAVGSFFLLAVPKITDFGLAKIAYAS
jgi:serine/threonine-protein kinase